MIPGIKLDARIEDGLTHFDILRPDPHGPPVSKRAHRPISGFRLQSRDELRWKCERRREPPRTTPAAKTFFDSKGARKTGTIEEIGQQHDVAAICQPLAH